MVPKIDIKFNLMVYYLSALSDDVDSEVLRSNLCCWEEDDWDTISSVNLLYALHLSFELASLGSQSPPHAV